MSISLELEFNNVRGHQDDRIPDRLLDRPSQINIECNVLAKLLVREDWNHNVSTREEIPNEGMICKVAGMKMTGDLEKAVCDKRIRRNMREFISQKGRIKRITFNLVDWEAVDKMMDNPPQHLYLWVINHVSNLWDKQNATQMGIKNICDMPLLHDIRIAGGHTSSVAFLGQGEGGVV